MVQCQYCHREIPPGQEQYALGQDWAACPDCARTASRAFNVIFVGPCEDCPYDDCSGCQYAAPQA